MSSASSRAPSVLVFAGSTRAGSLNRKLARITAEIAAQYCAHVSRLELAEYPLPLYENDLEVRAGLPATALALREQLQRHALWLIASPEHNNSMPALLKNAIDWASRPLPGEGYGSFFQQRAVALMSASPSRSGGSRGLPHLRQVLCYLGAQVWEQTFTLPQAHLAFDEHDQLKDAQLQAQLEGFVRSAVESAHPRTVPFELASIASG